MSNPGRGGLLRIVLSVLVALVLLASSACQADRTPADKWKTVEACGYKFRVPPDISSASFAKGIESDCGIYSDRPHHERGKFGEFEL